MARWQTARDISHSEAAVAASSSSTLMKAGWLVLSLWQASASWTSTPTWFAANSCSNSPRNDANTPSTCQPITHRLTSDSAPGLVLTSGRLTDCLSCGSTSHSTQNIAFRKSFPKPISWIGMEKTKPNTTKVRIRHSKETKCTVHCAEGSLKVNRITMISGQGLASFIDITNFTCILTSYGLSHKNLVDFFQNVCWISHGNCVGWICRRPGFSHRCKENCSFLCLF